MLQVGQGAIVCGSNPNPKYASGPIIITPSLNRRAFLASCVTLLTTPQHVAAAEPQVNGWNPAPEDTIATTDPACASCVGYVDGTLGSCSAVDAPCASSYDDRPAHFVAPWQYDGSTASAMQQLVDTLEAFDASVQQQTADYVYAVLDQGPSGTSLDLEFVFAPNDTTVALRAAQRTASDTSSSSGSSGTASSDAAQAAIALPINAVSSLLSQIGFNKDQPDQILEEIRMKLGWETVPILRNRQRLFFFGESPFDSFGPVAPPVPDYSRDLLDF